jgi:ANTAR domain
VPLTAAIVDTFDFHQRGLPTMRATVLPNDRNGLDPGSEELLTGLDGALVVQHRIQVAVGVLVESKKTSSDAAYAALRALAATSGRTLPQAAADVLATLSTD